MKTIEDAVIRFDGLWQECFDVGCAPLGLTRSEFESAARKMGYINGYRWGVEYPTNGKRPDLADDVDIEYKNGFHGDSWVAKAKVGHVYFCADFCGVYPVTFFRITDPRYKPVDEQEYEPVIITGADIAGGGGGGGFMPKAEPYFPPKKPVDEVSEKPESNWHERGELPPAGELCEFRIASSKEYSKCTFVGINSNKNFVIEVYGKYSSYHENQIEFRPIKSHREKVIDAAELVIRKTSSAVDNVLLDTLYAAGMLVLPGANCNTKD